MKSSFLSRRSARAALRAACFTALASLLGCVLIAQEQSSAAKLGSIKATGSSRFTSDQIVAVSGLKVGLPVSRDDFQHAADALGKTGRFSKVQYRYGDSDGGVQAEFEVADAPGLPVAFDNFPWFTDDQLIATLKMSVTLFDGTAPENGSVLDDISDILQLEIGKQGLHKAVSHSLTTAPGSDDRIQQFRIDDATLDLTSLEFSDALAQNDHGLHTRLPDIVGSKYSRAALALFEFEQVRPVYFAGGYLRVQFGTPTVHVTGTGSSAGVAVLAPVDPGPVIRWHPPTWSGNSVFGALELATMIPLHEGDPANGLKAEAGWEAVRNAYARRGYLEANVVPTPHFDSGSSAVTYSVAITEGPQFHMGKLVLTGLSIEGEKRIRGAWRIPEGAVFDRSVYEEFVSTGIREAFSGLPVHYEKIGKFLQENADSKTVDVLIDFQ